MTSYSKYRQQPRAKQPSKAARQRVRDAFDAEKLKHLCTTWDFSDYAQRVDLEPAWSGRERFYYHQDNGSNILGIAHLDSVQDDGEATVVETSAGLLVTSGALDDRLGVYTILELLPALGIKVDWLLTTDEEIGRSTADEFDTQKRYNWMFQFDRGGTDVVMYEYETPELVSLVEASTARVGIGSFSDICMLTHLGCSGFNWGVGYQDYHSPRSHAWLEDTFKMVARFVKFYNANSEIPLPFMDHTGTGGAFDKWQVADCGHWVDLDDSNTWVEDFAVIVCNSCGTIPTMEESA